MKAKEIFFLKLAVTHCCCLLLKQAHFLL